MVNTGAMPFNKGSFVGQLDGRTAPAQANDMTGDPPALSRFELTAAELRSLRITVTRLPGEYRVNYRSGTTTSPAHGKRGRRPRRMTPKAHNRRMRMAQLRRMRAWALKKVRA